jgi:hypothetical protein
MSAVLSRVFVGHPGRWGTMVDCFFPLERSRSDATCPYRLYVNQLHTESAFPDGVPHISRWRRVAERPAE